MAGSLTSRLEQLEKLMPAPRCAHPIGLWAPTPAELATAEQALKHCQVCKGQRPLLVMTQKKAREFKKLLAGSKF